MSGISSRRTYDTDSITLRRVYAYDISNNTPFSTGYVLTSLVKGVASFESPFVSLSTIGYLGLPAQISSINGVLQSTSEFLALLYPSSPTIAIVSSITGLGSAGYISTSQIQSTIEGLGTYGYISTFAVTGAFVSTVQGLGTSGYVSTASLYSSLTGLGTAGYISSASFFSTVNGYSLGGLVSTSQFYSTINNLGTVGYISSQSLFSTVRGLGSAGYVSTASIYRSSYSNTRVNVPNYNDLYLYTNLPGGSNVLSISFDCGNRLREKMIPGYSKIDLQISPNMQFGYFNSNSDIFRMTTSLINGTTYNTANLLASTSQTYYILNSNSVNLSFFFKNDFRFLISDSNIVRTIRDSTSQTMTLFHTFPTTPSINQFSASPETPTSVFFILDNTPRS